MKFTLPSKQEILLISVFIILLHVPKMIFQLDLFNLEQELTIIILTFVLTALTFIERN